MMTFSPLDEEQYEDIATQMTYWKIFEYILEDFVSREDAKKMMESSNLPVTTDVLVNAGQAVSAPPPSGAGTTTSPGTGDGSGNVRPIYDGDTATPGSISLKQQHKADLESGGATVKTFTAPIRAAAGDF
jgi:hypothetical protein